MGLKRWGLSQISTEMSNKTKNPFRKAERAQKQATVHGGMRLHPGCGREYFGAYT
jgi:hypothetical protein